MPPGPAFPVHVTMDSSGVIRDPHLNSFLRLVLCPSIIQFTSTHGSSVNADSHPRGPRAQYRRTRSNRSFEINLSVVVRVSGCVLCIYIYK